MQATVNQASRIAVAALAVQEHVRSGMVVGLGTGSTAFWVVQELGKRVSSGELRDLTFVCTSKETEKNAETCGLTVTEVDKLNGRPIDVAIDGADEIALSSDGQYNLLKGRGAALYREKFIEQLAKSFICVADEGKLVPRLAQEYLPVEIVGTWNSAFLRSRVERICNQHGRVTEARIRVAGDFAGPLITDNGNCIVDVCFDENGILDPQSLERALKQAVGVVESGLFCGMKPTVILGDASGRAWTLQKA